MNIDTCRIKRMVGKIPGSQEFGSGIECQWWHHPHTHGGEVCASGT